MPVSPIDHFSPLTFSLHQHFALLPTNLDGNRPESISWFSVGNHKINILYQISFQIKIALTPSYIFNFHFCRPTTRTTKTISSASDSSRSSILTTDRSLREGGEVYTYVNFQPEILNCELVRLDFSMSTPTQNM